MTNTTVTHAIATPSILSGDHDQLLRKVGSESLLKLAFKYAIHHREHSDFFYDPLELQWARTYEDQLIEELQRSLVDPDSYSTQPAFSYFPPKSGLCYRRMIYLPIKDLIARYSLIATIADCADRWLYRFSFANRRATAEDANSMLLEPFAKTSWPAFCRWQKEQITGTGGYKVLLKTDISAFYDSISHDYMISALAKVLNIEPSCTLLNWVRKLLSPEIHSYSEGGITTSEYLRQGLCIGNSCDGVLANIYLHEIDSVMNAYCAENAVAYARYNDDVRLFANSRYDARKAVLLLQKHLLKKGLNLNTSKTKFADDTNSMEALIKDDTDYYTYEDCDEYSGSDEDCAYQEEEEDDADCDESYDHSESNDCRNNSDLNPQTSRVLKNLTDSTTSRALYVFQCRSQPLNFGN